MKAIHGALALAVAAALAGCGGPGASQTTTTTAPAPAGDNMLPAAPVSDGNAAPVPLPNDQVSADQSAAIGHDATTSTQRADDSDGLGVGGGGGGATDDADEVTSDVATDDTWEAQDGDIGDGEDLSDEELDARG